MNKGGYVTVRTEAGRGVNCCIVDVEGNKIWIRLPTNQVLEMVFDGKRKLYTGYLARMEFTVNPKE